MNALEALKLAKENPGIKVRVKGHSTAYSIGRSDEGLTIWFGLRYHAFQELSLRFIINDDGTPVEWEQLPEGSEGQ